MNSKSEVAKLFQDFYSMVENQFQTKISILRSDNGIKFYNDCLGEFLFIYFLFFYRERYFTSINL